MSDMDFLVDDSGPEPEGPQRAPWRVLVVDDDPQVYAVTRLVLSNSVFQERPIQLLAAASGEEARRILRDTDDIAVVLLDVVMESDHAGLDLVRAIRLELGLQAIRIILRTGQPGLAPEHRVIIDYDIDDYRLKSELTEQGLFTAIISALRAYQLIGELAEHRRKAIESLTQQIMFEDRILDILDQPVLMTDIFASITSCNEPLAGMLGLSRDDLLGRNIWEALPEGLARIIEDREIAADQIGVARDHRTTLPDGRPAAVRTLVIPMDDGSAGGLVCALRLD